MSVLRDERLIPTAKGRHYPSPAPSLPGESDDDYTNRLTGVFGEEAQPYDHRRFRQCSIGYHNECSQRRLSRPECECPCHTDPGPTEWPSLLTDSRMDALVYMYDIPGRTVARVLFIAKTAMNTATSLSEVAAALETAYGCPQNDGFVVDIVRLIGDALKVDGTAPATLDTLLTAADTRFPRPER